MMTLSQLIYEEGSFGVFLLVTFAWIFFRASTLSDALYVVAHLGTGWGSLRSSFLSPAGAFAVGPFECAVGVAGIALNSASPRYRRSSLSSAPKNAFRSGSRPPGPSLFSGYIRASP